MDSSSSVSAKTLTASGKSSVAMTPYHVKRVSAQRLSCGSPADTTVPGPLTAPLPMLRVTPASFVSHSRGRSGCIRQDLDGVREVIDGDDALPR